MHNDNDNDDNNNTITDVFVFVFAPLDPPWPHFAPLCTTWLTYVEPFRTVKCTCGWDGMDGMDGYISDHYYHKSTASGANNK